MLLFSVRVDLGRIVHLTKVFYIVCVSAINHKLCILHRKHSQHNLFRLLCRYTRENSEKNLLSSRQSEKSNYCESWAGRVICWNVSAACTQPLLLQSSVLALDMVPSLTLTDAHLPGSSQHLFIYLFICVMFIY